MSTVKTTNITHGSNSGTSNIVLGSDGSVTFASGAATGTEKGRNLIINGAMQVAQRGTSSTDVGSPKTVDRWTYNENDSSGAATQSRVTDAPEGFGYSYKIECTSANASPAADVYNIIFTSFEGQDLQHIKKGTSNAQQLTASFWVKGNAAATYTCELRDHDNTRFCSQTFNVTTSWSRVTLTFAADTTGAFDNDNNLSMYLFIWLGGGSNYSGGTWTSNTWHTTDNKRIGDSTTNFFDSTDRTFFLTGVQLELGATATTFEHKSYADELVRCQRYYYRIDAATNDYFGIGNIDGSNTGQILVTFPIEMRVKPSSLDTTGTASHYILRTTSNQTCTSVPTLSGHQTTKNAMLYFTKTSHGFTSGHGAFGRSNDNSSFLGFSAEL